MALFIFRKTRSAPLGASVKYDARKCNAKLKVNKWCGAIPPARDTYSECHGWPKSSKATVTARASSSLIHGSPSALTVHGMAVSTPPCNEPISRRMPPCGQSPCRLLVLCYESLRCVLLLRHEFPIHSGNETFPGHGNASTSPTSWRLRRYRPFPYSEDRAQCPSVPFHVCRLR